MSKYKVLDYKIKETIAEIRFDNGLYFQLVPCRDENHNVIGLDSALLFDDGVLVACYLDRTYQQESKPEHSGFWSKQEIEQQQLAKYWNAVVQAVKQEDNEIYEMIHQGSEIRETLEQGIAKGFGQKL